MSKWMLLAIFGLFLGAWPVAAATLSLEDCLRLVREQNPSLRTASSEPQLAALDAAAARSAYRPKISLNGGYSQQQAAQQVLIGGMSEPTQDQGYFHASLGIDQLLYDFGRTEGRVEAAKADNRAAEFNFVATEQDLLLQTVVAYYRILNASALLQAANDERTLTAEHLRSARVLYDQGVVTRNDVLQAEVHLAGSRQQVMAREGERENAWLNLNYLTGRPAEARDELVVDAETFSIPETGMYQTAKRPDLLAQNERVVSAQEEITREKGDFWPELYSRIGADYVENSHVKEQTIYSATLGLRFTLYDGAARDLQLSKAQEKLRRARQRLADLENRARVEEQTARNDAQVAVKQIAVAEETIRQAEENLRINQGRYQEQVGTATEVLDAQTLLTQSRTDLARAQFNYQLAVARMRHAAGRL